MPAHVISIEDFMFAIHDGAIDTTATGASLRDRAARTAEVLAWHVKNSPLWVWNAAAAKNDLRWPHGLLHGLFDARPKRQATPAERAEIVRLLTAEIGYARDDLVEWLCNDPDWHLFALPKPDSDKGL